VSTLFIVATPIGNLQDMSPRGIEVLSDVDVVACEDTRRTLKLLNAFALKKRLMSCHARREREAAESIRALLAQGKSVAYVSDAGTPGISDPGSVLARQVRAAGFPVIPIPGPSAFAALCSISGFAGKSVLFEGFLSPKPGRRRKRLEALADIGVPFILYE
jgi:16S rRNA (cytidine1402-2'-O)-methyltransferase